MPVESVKAPDAATASAGMVDAASMAKSVATHAATLQARRKADVLFVLDCTGSMQGEIDAIKDAIMSFADTIESDGVRVRVGLIEFRDRLIGEEHRVLTFTGEPFTSDPAVFRRAVAALQAEGGGDEPESSLDALMLALRQPFASDANKVIVLVTDAPPHIPDQETIGIEEVVRAIQRAGVQQLYLVMRTKDPSSQVYLKLLEGTRGMAFELGIGDDFRERAEDFKRTLMALGKTISMATR
jgi:Mg-chelatase subunit ChlD